MMILSKYGSLWPSLVFRILEIRILKDLPKQDG